jgi:hypothetical protein
LNQLFQKIIALDIDEGIFYLGTVKKISKPLQLAASMAELSLS